MEKIETILTNCIREIKSGKATLAECLDRYPSTRRELESLLKMALNIQEPPAFNLDSSYKQAAKAQLLRQIQATNQKKSRSFTDIFSFGLPPKFVWARVAVSVLAVVILISMLAGGTAYAAKGSLPGDLLYPVKIGTEDARLLIAGNSPAKAELNLEFANTRLIEMSKLANRDKGKTGLAVNGYRSNLADAREQIRKISDASSLSNLIDRVLEDVQNQVVFCDSVIDANPAYSGPVNEASTLAINQQVDFLEMLAQQNILRAAQINLDTMQNRLQRANVKAHASQYETMQEALLQYQQFNRLGEQILQSAQTSNNHNTEIEALSLQALTRYLDTLNDISQQVPLEYQSSIETSIQMTLQFQTQARHRYQKQGNPDASPGAGAGEPGSGTGEPGSGAGESGSGAGESGSGTGEPGSGAGESGAGAGDPGSGTGEPGSGTGEPGSGAGESGSGAGEPGAGAGEPGSGTGEPVAGAGEPGSSAGEPGAGAGEPGAGAGEPGK
ncbi:DUF5667 domain-containing protein [Chloroflexota bacterium]